MNEDEFQYGQDDYQYAQDDMQYGQGNIPYDQGNVSYDQGNVPYEEPVVAKPKKKNMKRYIGMAALYGCSAAIIFFLLTVILLIMNTTKTSRVTKLSEAYEKYTNGDTTALSDIEDLAEKYEPAQIVLNLIQEQQNTEAAAATDTTAAAGTAATTGTDTTAAAAGSSTETFGTSTAAATDTTEATDTTATDAAAADTTTTETADDTADEASKEVDEEVQTAIDAWADGDYTGAKEQFDALAKQGKLDFDPETADDEILEYGAVCGMLDLYNNVSKSLSYEDALIYDYEPESTVAGFDLTKPVYYFDTASGIYLCAYSTSSNSYVHWTDSKTDSDLVEDVETSGVEYDVLSATTLLKIRKQVQ